MGPRRSTTSKVVQPTEEVDEQSLAHHVEDNERAARGAYFTPREVVTQVLEAVEPLLPRGRSVRLIDPACGAGAFLTQAAERWPRANAFGVELNPRSARMCRERLGGRGTVLEADALVNELALPDDDAFEVWLGNPPWNGTSPLLKEPAAWKRVTALLPREFVLKSGTSLREDFVFFLLLAAQRLRARGGGVLAFLTSATLLDAFAHEPVRAALLSMLRLESVAVLPRGTFTNTRVEPCVTVWRAGATGSAIAIGPNFNLRPGWQGAERLDGEWRSRGATISQLVPVSFAGLKTRFDELLVDDDRAALVGRVRAFIAGRDCGLVGFDDKLATLRSFMGVGVRFEERNVRRFLRYRGPNPMGVDAWCYVDRRLIPRGDHRLRGQFDPHASKLKLVFNLHELPLAAHVMEREGCVTMYRHSRFAPEFVPRALLTDPRAQDFDASDLVPNLTPLGRKIGTVRQVFQRIATHVMSTPFQSQWAPAFGASREPLIELGRKRASSAQRDLPFSE